MRKYTFLFSQFPRKNIVTMISFDGHKYDTLKLIPSKWMPLQLESTISFTPINKIFLKTKASDLFFRLKGLSDAKLFFDTIHVK